MEAHEDIAGPHFLFTLCFLFSRKRSSCAVLPPCVFHGQLHSLKPSQRTLLLPLVAYCLLFSHSKAGQPIQPAGPHLLQAQLDFYDICHTSESLRKSHHEGQADLSWPVARLLETVLSVLTARKIHSECGLYQFRVRASKPEEERLLATMHVGKQG